MEIQVNTKQRTYPIILERGSLYRAKEIIKPKGRVFIVSDDGVPKKWQDALQSQFDDAPIYIFKNGEASKNMHTYEEILRHMLECKLSRKDMVIALGGGVVGDMAGFAAATYMRGIEYVNIPTTTLSQIDSSIGGKTAIDLAGVKNCVGCFWQPSAVIVDTDTISTLSVRHFHNGLAEAVKTGLILDESLFTLFEQDDYEEHLDEIIEKCLYAKKKIVEEDEREGGKRKLLNFGHTYGHAYESYHELDEYYHGECVAMGMMTILKNEEIKARLEKVLHRLSLPTKCEADNDKIIDLILNDKKTDHNHVTIIQVDEIGKGHLEDWSIDEIKKVLDK